MGDPEFERRVDAVRSFSRFYTRRIGVLRERLHDSGLTLPEARIVYELAQREHATASELAVELSLDAGYLSRLLRGLGRRKLIARRRDDADARQVALSLTAPGRVAFATIDGRSRDEIAAMLTALSAPAQRRLVDSLESVRQLLDPDPEPRVPYLLRAHRPGDIGWVIHRHGALYAAEYGWDETFEGLVAQIAGDFLRRFKPGRERCWIAERDGVVVGSIFLVAKSATVAQLRLLYVEPEVRGLGIGRRLVDECLRFAREAGYAKVMLWTNDVLVSARRIYEAAGFRLVGEEAHHSFGHRLTGQNWEITFDRGAASAHRRRRGA
jgi:DNA-binding MarR family transcriptional regulator/GNAT superfamily N-acetyltransferase